MEMERRKERENSLCQVVMIEYVSVLILLTTALSHAFMYAAQLVLFPLTDQPKSEPDENCAGCLDRVCSLRDELYRISIIFEMCGVRLWSWDDIGRGKIDEGKEWRQRHGRMFVVGVV